MADVVGRVFLLLVAVVSLSACAEPVKQWYKPGRNYTVADFQRDQAECTKAKVLDEDCMRERRWVAISADEDKLPPMQGGGTPSKPRYAPK